MWSTDIVYLQTKTDVNTIGSIKSTWVDVAEIPCDVQPMSKEKANKNYGFTDANIWKTVFVPSFNVTYNFLNGFTNDFLNNYMHNELGQTNYENFVIPFKEGHQVKYDGKQWLIRLVQDLSKIDKSNHMFMILSEVI